MSLCEGRNTAPAVHEIVALLVLPYNGVSHQNALSFSHGMQPFRWPPLIRLKFAEKININPKKASIISEWSLSKEMTSASSSSKAIKDEQVDQPKVHKPRWIEAFLRKTFFDSCTAHPFRRNELNKYCINCNLSACQYCASSGPHRHHKILKIYRHVYKDVVSLSAMEKYIDCSEIQPYKCNKRLVISLNPLPHCGSALNDEASCNVCSRKLTEPDLYRYCSISCKVKAVSGKPNDSVPPFISIQSPPQETQEETTSEPRQEETSEPQKLRKRRRKGTPHRAPFF